MKTHPQADPLAALTAQAAWAETGGRGVILFGSRALGKHRPDSDVDIMVPTHGATSEHDANLLTARLSALGAQIYGRPIKVSATCMQRGVFGRMRRSVNHLAAIAAREGIAFTDSPEYFSYDPADLSMEPLVTRRIRQNALATVNQIAWEMREHEIDRLIERDAAAAMRMALSCLLSANLVEIGRNDNIYQLVSRVADVQPEANLSTRIPMEIYIDFEQRPLAEDCNLISVYDIDRPTARIRADVQRIMNNVPDLKKHPWPRRKRKTQPGSGRTGR